MSMLRELALVYYAPERGRPGDGTDVGSLAAQLASHLPLVVAYTMSGAAAGLLIAGKFLDWPGLGADDPWA